MLFAALSELQLMLYWQGNRFSFNCQSEMPELNDCDDSTTLTALLSPPGVGQSNARNWSGVSPASFAIAPIVIALIGL